MNIEFSNSYQEVLLENLESILKQNFMMQTRLKLLEKETNNRAEMQAKIEELTVKHQEALEQIGQTQHYRTQAESNDSIVQEKSRIQSALNDTMRELGITKNLLNLKSKEVEEMKSRIFELENLIPSTSKVVKKFTAKTEEKPVEISATETNKLKVEVGGTF
jgi:chromosome segregation ATPase